MKIILKMFKNKNYEAKKVTADDMFPRTPHIEAVARLEKIK